MKNIKNTTFIKLNCYKSLWLAAFAILLIDQLTKILAINFLHFDTEYQLNKYVSFHTIYNESSMMLLYDFVWHFDWSLTQFRIFYVSCCFVLSYIIFWLMNQPSMKEDSWKAELAKTGLMIIFGGLLGNAFDRIFRAEGVIDFFRLNFIQNIVPIVNFADIMIYLGEACVIAAWLVIFYELMMKKLKKY